MKARVLVSDQVRDFLAALAPEPRHRLRVAMSGLADGRGDVTNLGRELTGYSRLRVGPYRVVFAERFEAGSRVFECVAVAPRDVIYELAARIEAEAAVRRLGLGSPRP
jgi:mRNA-degrading endonuclease RelE of RelBE toxin-antitoxin system